MANTYFQFKQFRVEQDRCAMKVCTDSCLFGAWVPVEEARSILDIGTGTGLLTLMAAQRSSAQIQAVEIDASAARQAQENFSQSPWANRLQLFKSSLQDFELVNTTTYDLIISNPPFYQKSQKSVDYARNQAMHTIDLPFEAILQFCEKFLSSEGSVYLLLPPHEAKLVSTLATAFGLYLQQEIKIFTKDKGKYIRSILQFRSHPSANIQSSSICIRTALEEYTSDFRKLLQPYYLFF